MKKSDSEVIEKLKNIYAENFAGKDNQRFLILWSDIRALYGFQKLFESRFRGLAESATDSGLYLWDLGEGENGHLVAVVKIRTVDRWRKVPRKVIQAHRAPLEVEAVQEVEDDD